MVPSCKGLSYMERLKVLGIPTLKYRRCRGDMIETYKILHGTYDTAVAPVLPQSINIRLIKAWQNAGLQIWIIEHTTKKKVISIKCSGPILELANQILICVLVQHTYDKITV